ncbi:MAG: BolA/IbaG family iron-sulfur metabolism protein [Parahaliea sp.]
MDAASVQALLEAHFENSKVQVEGGGSHYLVSVISEAFAGQPKVRRQQMVMAGVAAQFADGSIHAFDRIVALTPEEAGSEG